MRLRAAGALAAGAAGLGLGAVRLRDRRRVRACWETVADAPPAVEPFDPGSVADLPGPARRYLRHAIEPGTPLATSVELRMTGEIRLGDGGGADGADGNDPAEERAHDNAADGDGADGSGADGDGAEGEGASWWPFAARQVLSADGFVWRPRVRLGRVGWLSGADTYCDGRGRVRFFLLGLVPVVDQRGPDVDRSAAGRLAIESVLLPTLLLPDRGATWEAADESRARVTRSVGGVPETVTLTVADDGGLAAAGMDRYREDGREPFGVAVAREQTRGGLTVPSALRAGWGFGTPDYREFFRATVETLSFG